MRYRFRLNWNCVVKKIKTNIINEKKILIIGYGSMGKKYEKILSKNLKSSFLIRKKSKKKNKS